MYSASSDVFKSMLTGIHAKDILIGSCQTDIALHLPCAKAVVYIDTCPITVMLICCFRTQTRAFVVQRLCTASEVDVGGTSTPTARSTKFLSAVRDGGGDFWWVSESVYGHPA